LSAIDFAYAVANITRCTYCLFRRHDFAAAVTLLIFSLIAFSDALLRISSSLFAFDTMLLRYFAITLPP